MSFSYVNMPMKLVNHSKCEVKRVRYVLNSDSSILRRNFKQPTKNLLHVSIIYLSDLLK